MLICGVERSAWTKRVPPDWRAMNSAVAGVICISPRAPACEVWSRNFDSS